MVGLVSPNAARSVVAARSRPQDLPWTITTTTVASRLWCACPPGMRDGLVKAQPDQYFVPPYVAFRGWIGVRRGSRADWDDVERVIRGPYLAVAPKKLAAAFLER